MSGGVGERTGERLVLVMTLPSGVKEFDLSTPHVAIGRASSGQIVIDDPSVSRAHAEIVVSENAVLLRDLGSTNGTFLNGRQVEAHGADVQPVALHDGDEVAFGDVLGHVKARPSTAGATEKLMDANAFEERLTTEADRCIRYDRSLTMLALQTFNQQDGIDVGTLVAGLLRSHDAAVVRSRARIDVLAPECDRERATTLARRIVESLGEARVSVRIALATFPTDVPSPTSLCAAAEAGLSEVTLGGYGWAKWGVRQVTIGSRDIAVADACMARLFGVIERLSKSNAPVLVCGETGSGKEIIAEAVHVMSERAGRALVRVNCAAMPSALVESELFGHVRGAFSGAERDKVGLIEEADGGTLFLDEIGEFELPLQAKLLRFLEDHRIRRVGATPETAVDVRIIAATHRDLKAAAVAGHFREDLYYRLSGIVLQVPPLRERPREILVLAERFVADFSAGLGRRRPRIAQQTVAMLQGYAWPGNVRELRNVIQRAVLACDGDELRAEHVDLEVTTQPTAPVPTAPVEEVSDATKPINLEANLREVERRAIIEALERCGGNQTRAAELLAMPRRTLVHKLRALGIQRARRPS